MLVLSIAFWASVAWIVYAVAVYPTLSVLIGSVLAHRRAVRKGDYTPSLSVIVSTYNEERVIEDKLRQTLALDYPADRLEVIVASDASTDRTDEIVRSFGDPRVVLHRAAGRVGKTAALEGAVAIARGELLVFSDATGVFERNALRALASNFADPTVGCVAGRVVYRYGADTTSRGFRGYQRFAVAVRRAENAFGDQTSVSGSIHAMRRTLFRPAPPGFSMDVIDAVHTVIQGYRVVYEWDAVSIEASRIRIRDEWQARVRMSVRNTGMAPYIVRQLAAHGKPFFAFQMLSHKMTRWWLWLPLVVAFATSVALSLRGAHRPYVMAAALQAAFYLVASASLALGSRIPLARVASVAGFFLMINAAACIGTLKRLAGEQRPAWEPIRTC